MFTGIINAVAKVKQAQRKSGSLFLTIKKPIHWRIKAGDSIATDGVCLTVKQVRGNTYQTELMPETLCKTYFGRQVPSYVNIEQPLRLMDFLNGHLVLGHVDAVGKIAEKRNASGSKICKINFPKKFVHLITPKGSVAVDGISLTPVDVGKGWFTVSLVEYTLTHTTIGKKQKSDLVNLEFDILAKYLARVITNNS